MKIRISETKPEQAYDIVIVCCGYESRSRSLVERRGRFEADRLLALGYGAMEECAFAENEAYLRTSGFELVRVGDDEFSEFIDSVFSAFNDENELRVLLDISCFTRIRLGQLLEALSRRSAYLLDVYYSLAAFNPPPAQEPHNEFLCPVSSFYSGWTGESERPLGLVCGLGYEQLKALGIIEVLDPVETWLFFPESTIPQYDESVRAANYLLLGQVPRSNVVGYPVLEGTAILRALMALVSAVREQHRCILMPLGPKIFAFCSLLVGSIYQDVSVWRASSGRFATPVDRQASDDFGEFRVECARVSDVEDSSD